MSDINYVNDINFNNLPNTGEDDINWVLDYTPNHNIIDNIYNDSFYNDSFYNGSFYNHSYQLTRQNRNIQIYHNNNEDFIPFETEEPIQLSTEVGEIHISEEERDCPICFETREIEEMSSINCGHKFCGNCITEHIRSNRIKSRCPLCRENIIHINFQTHQQNDSFLEI